MAIQESFKTNFVELFNKMSVNQTGDYFTANEQTLIRQITTDFNAFQELLTTKIEILAKRIAMEDLVKVSKI